MNRHVMAAFALTACFARGGHGSPPDEGEACYEVEAETPFSVTILDELDDSTQCNRLALQPDLSFEVRSAATPYYYNDDPEACPAVAANGAPDLLQTSYQYLECFSTLEPLGVRCLVNYLELCDSETSGGSVHFAFGAVPRDPEEPALETDLWITDTPGSECYPAVSACRDHFDVMIERGDP